MCRVDDDDDVDNKRGKLIFMARGAHCKKLVFVTIFDIFKLKKNASKACHEHLI